MKWKVIIMGMVLSVFFMAPNIVENVLAAAKSAVTIDVDAGGYATNEVNGTDVSGWKEKTYYGSESGEQIHLVVSVENTGKVTGKLGVRVDILSHDGDCSTYWCHYAEDDSTYNHVELQDAATTLVDLPAGHEIYLFDMVVDPEAFSFDGPVIFTAILFDKDDNHLIGIDMKTVFLGTDFKVWTKLP
ncbi:MAG: hypothetical protein J7K15_08100 [Deltaproteobacteria bacterium]|nr:hypothetical protein [Deltaproteobacteria bacterium]